MDSEPTTLARFIPSMAWLSRYQKQWLRPDIVAGLTAAAVVIPKAMAYATIAGLPVQIGLYTVFVPMVIYALLGTSRPLSVSTTTTIAILAAAELGSVVPDGSASQLIAAGATLSVLVGIMLIAAFALRLGFVANFISEPVLTGFKSGIGLVIVVDQIPKLLGIHFEKGGFMHNLLAIGQHLPQTNVTALVLALVMLALIYAMERFAPRAPAPLVAVAVGIAASALLGLQAAGIETVGTVPRGLPELVWPQFNLFAQMWPAAAGIALMSFTETIAAARAFGAPDGATSHAESRAACHWHGQCGGRFAGCDAGRRRYDANGGQPHRGAHARNWPSSSLPRSRWRRCWCSRR
jgi:MFS superfamily sulfate permease-like transporter